MRSVVVHFLGASLKKGRKETKKDDLPLLLTSRRVARVSIKTKNFLIFVRFLKKPSADWILTRKNLWIIHNKSERKIKLHERTARRLAKVKIFFPAKSYVNDAKLRRAARLFILI